MIQSAGSCFGRIFCSAKNRAIRLYLFCLRQKRIPLLSLARSPVELSSANPGKTAGPYIQNTKGQIRRLRPKASIPYRNIFWGSHRVVLLLNTLPRASLGVLPSCSFVRHCGKFLNIRLAFTACWCRNIIQIAGGGIKTGRRNI
jgi:hypothetical protein